MSECRHWVEVEDDDTEMAATLLTMRLRRHGYSVTRCRFFAPHDSEAPDAPCLLVVHTREGECMLEFGPEEISDDMGDDKIAAAFARMIEAEGVLRTLN